MNGFKEIDIYGLIYFSMYQLMQVLLIRIVSDWSCQTIISEEDISTLIL